MKACSLTDGCVAASYVGENCYMKSALNSASENSGVIGISVTDRESTGGSTSETPQTCPSSYTCPENDGRTFKGTDLRSFTLFCGVDYYGDDLAGQYAQSYQACTQACSDNANCVAASFTGGKNDGYCYLKSKNNRATKNDNVNAVFYDTRVAPSPTSSTSSVTPSSTLTTTFSATPVVSQTPATLSTSIVTPSTPVVSSSSIIFSTSTTPSVTSTPTPLPPGPNMLTNTGFELNGGTETPRITDWVITNIVYTVVQARHAHGGNSYFVMNLSRGKKPERSQAVNGVDVNRSYQFTF
ncbi:hypothetical protein E8E11_008652 [Didymella keratinophila]|nr:hypothetical protein E8E11_008652 [Didymella keratinophila]